jgi:hypothetical protein
MLLSDLVRIVRVSNAVAAGVTTLTSTISRHGYSGALIIALLGDVTATSALALTASLGDLSNGSDGVAVPGGSAAFTAGATDADNKILAVDVQFNSRDFLTWSLARGVANAVVDGVFVILYDAKVLTVPNDDASMLRLVKAIAG